jgi:hypothetical protein
LTRFTYLFPAAQVGLSTGLVVVDIEPPFMVDRFRFLRLDDAVDDDEDTEGVLAAA